MKTFFKITRDAKIFSIEGKDRTLIDVALIEKYGNGTAFQVFAPFLEDILLYCPQDRDLTNLVKGNYKSYVSENRIEITNAINSIKEI